MIRERGVGLSFFPTAPPVIAFEPAPPLRHTTASTFGEPLKQTAKTDSPATAVDTVDGTDPFSFGHPPEGNPSPSSAWGEKRLGDSSTPNPGSADKFPTEGSMPAPVTTRPRASTAILMADPGFARTVHVARRIGSRS